MASKNLQSWIHPLATAVIILGCFGAFPQPPRAIMKLTRYELFKWFLVFVLIYQGGGGMDLNKSLAATVILYVIVKMFELNDAVDPNVMIPAAAQPAPATVQVAAQAASAAATQATAEATNDKGAAAQAGQTAAQKVEKFLGGYYM